jgi:hypothetical protein
MLTMHLSIVHKYFFIYRSYGTMGINNGRIRSFEMAWHFFGEEKIK